MSTIVLFEPILIIF